METSSLIRKQVRRILSELYPKSDVPRFFIKFSNKKNTFILYKRFYGFDQFDNKNEQISVVQDLSPDPQEAKKIAKELTGQDLEIKLPSEQKQVNRGKMVMPFLEYKGKRLEEIPLNHLIKFIFNNRWISTIRKDPYRLNIYEYLTKDILAETEQYLYKYVKAMDTPELILKYNEYLKEGINYGIEKMVFANLLTPIMERELSERRVLHKP